MAREKAEREGRIDTLLTNMRAGRVEPETLDQPDKCGPDRLAEMDAVEKFFQENIIGYCFIAKTAHAFDVFIVGEGLEGGLENAGVHVAVSKSSGQEYVLKLMNCAYSGWQEIERMQRMNAVDAARGTRFSPRVVSTRLAFGSVPLGRGNAVLMEKAPGRVIGGRFTAARESDRVLDIVREQLPSLMTTMAAAGIIVVGNPIAVGSGGCANIAYRSCWYKNITFSEHLQHDHGALARQTWPRCACAPEIFTLAWHTYVQYV